MQENFPVNWHLRKSQMEPTPECLRRGSRRAFKRMVNTHREEDCVGEGTLNWESVLLWMLLLSKRAKDPVWDQQWWVCLYLLVCLHLKTISRDCTMQNTCNNEE